MPIFSVGVAVGDGIQNLAQREIESKKASEDARLSAWSGI